MAPRHAHIFLAAAAIRPFGVTADGIGMIGFGKDMYTPACAAACRNIVKGCKLSCTPEELTVNHGTSHSPVATPPECFVSDFAFLKTVAVCIDNYCPMSDQPSMAIIDDYWASHLAVTTVGDYTWVPVLSYTEALRAGREDEEKTALRDNNRTEGSMEHSAGHDHMHRRHAEDELPPGTPDVKSPLPPIAKGEPLNVTSFIVPRDWKLQHNGFLDFEENEVGHAKYTIVVCIVAIFTPIVLSLTRSIPGLKQSQLWNKIQDRLVHPALWGKRHRAQSTFSPANLQVAVPTRGQSLYIALISLLNLVFLIAPYVYRHPQTTFASREQHETSLIGNRAGSMAMGNAVALVVFASKNSPLFWLTDWSYGTYLILHRWLGYWTVFHTALHSVMLWAYYEKWGDYEAEFAREYWAWGIVATVAVVAIVPFSISAVRRRVYDFFLATHVVFTLLFLIGYYYHIWYLYEFRWGYEIWTYIFGAIWGVERLVRLLRLVRGFKMATVTLVEGSEAEYVRIDIEGTAMDHGVVYLGFPTIGWRFWEFHPFSVAFASAGDEESRPTAVAEVENPSTSESEKGVDITTRTPPNDVVPPTTASLARKPTTTILARVRDGMTKSLAARAKRHSPARLRVLVEGPYTHSGSASQLRGCSRIVCIAGGVGITAVLPYMAPSSSLIGAATTRQLYWSTRNNSLVKELQGLTNPSQTNILVGDRFDMEGILEKEFRTAHELKEKGPLGVIVCGPGSMADDARHACLELRKSSEIGSTTSLVFVDESFTF